MFFLYRQCNTFIASIKFPERGGWLMGALRRVENWLNNLETVFELVRRVLNKSTPTCCFQDSADFSMLTALGFANTCESAKEC